MPVTQLNVGPQNNPVGAANIIARLGRQGDQIASELHGRFFEQNFNKNLFFVATQALVTTTVGLATTYTGLVLSNPLTSGVNLSVISASMMQSVIQGTQVEGYGLATGFNNATNVTHTTPVTPQTAFIGSGAAPKALADVSATLPTAPVYAEFLNNTQSATTNSPGAIVETAGRYLLAPGAYILFVTPTQASVAGLWFSFCWEEVPV